MVFISDTLAVTAVVSTTGHVPAKSTGMSQLHFRAWVQVLILCASHVSATLPSYVTVPPTCIVYEYVAATCCSNMSPRRVSSCRATFRSGKETRSTQMLKIAEYWMLSLHKFLRLVSFSFCNFHAFEFDVIMHQHKHDTFKTNDFHYLANSSLYRDALDSRLVM